MNENIQKAVWTGHLSDLDTWAKVPVAVVWDDGFVQQIAKVEKITGQNNDWHLYWTLTADRSGKVIAIIVDDRVTTHNLTLMPGGTITIDQRVHLE